VGKGSGGLRRLDRLDVAVIVVALGLLAALGLTIVRGDQVGLQIVAVLPRESGSIRATVQVTFDEPIEQAALAPAFSIEPTVPGVLSVEGRTATFRPAERLTLGTTYTVRVKAGVASAQSGRALKEGREWQFAVRGPRLTFLKPDPANPISYNLFLVDPSYAGDGLPTPQQLTFSETGVVEHDASPDGAQIAYSEFKQQGNNNLYLWNAATGQSTLLFDCPEAVCNNPVWRPDGGAIAFQRADLSFGSVGISRVWLLDMQTRRVRPLFSDSQIIGFDPRWSPDGGKIGVFSQSYPGIAIYDFASDVIQVIDTSYGQNGDFSPDGRWMVFPKMVQIAEKVYATHFVLSDVTTSTLTQRDTVAATQEMNDVEAVWLDAQMLIIARRPPFKPSSGGLSPGPQLYMLNIETGDGTPLLVDEAYSNGNLRLSPTRKQLAFQRFALGKQGARPELWVLDLDTRDARQVANDAINPRWLP
jgi:Tol biopolymer transport system component